MEREVTITLDEYKKMHETVYRLKPCEESLYKIYKLLEEYATTDNVASWENVKGIGIKIHGDFTKELLLLLYYHNPLQYNFIVEKIKRNETTKKEV